MDAQLVAAAGGIVIAFITGFFALFSARMRKENGAAHDTNFSVLKSIDKRTEQIDRKLDSTAEKLASHEGWHKGRGDDL